MNSLTIKGVIVEGLSIQTDNSQSKPINPISQIKKHANQLMSIGKAQRNGLANLIKLGLMGASLLTLPLSGYSAISATTSQTILGTEPYFVLIDGTTRTPLTSTDELLSFGYIDKDGNTKTADASMKDITIVVDASMTHNQLITLVTRDGNAHGLNGLLGVTGSSLGIDDDDDDATGVTAYGSYSAKLTKDGVLVPATDTNPFDACSVYQLELKTINDTTLGKIRAKTTYGAPDYRDYTAITVAYTLQPDVAAPYACYAQPNNLTVRSSGGAPEWDNIKGFFPARTPVYPTTNTTSKNFPTTGFHGAEFKLTVAGTTAKQVIEDTALASSISTTGTITKGTYTPTGSAVSLELSTDSATSKVLSVMLTGPNMTTLPTAAHSATTFTLKSGSTDVYIFELEKWFIAKTGVTVYSSDNYSSSHPQAATANNETPKYCAGLTGTAGEYQVPSVVDYTNAAVTVGYGGVVGGEYTRSIDGGLFAEWGNTNNNMSNYPFSDFEFVNYWVRESQSFVLQYSVLSFDGSVMMFNPSNNLRAACVSP